MPLPATPTKRFRLDLAYDGRSFEGWLCQPRGITVQDAVTAGLRGICGVIRSVEGSGRTDAGVSARQQVAHFDAPMSSRMEAEHWQRALNSVLPAAVRVIACGEVDGSFHARYSALKKTYCYRIAHGEVLLPWHQGLRWHHRFKGDVSSLGEIFALYQGTHDFKAFAANRNDGKDEDRDACRTISAIVTERDNDEIRVKLTGNGFLYKMVRFLVGSAVYCCDGKISEQALIDLLRDPPCREKAPFCAPADGLILEGVSYPTEYQISSA